MKKGPSNRQNRSNASIAIDRRPAIDIRNARLVLAVPTTLASSAAML